MTKYTATDYERVLKSIKEDFTSEIELDYDTSEQDYRESIIENTEVIIENKIAMIKATTDEDRQKAQDNIDRLYKEDKLYMSETHDEIEKRLEQKQ